MTDQSYSEQILQRLARIEQRVADTQRQITELARQLHGNGQPGLVQRVSALESSTSISGRLLWLVIGAGMAGGVQLVLALMKVIT